MINTTENESTRATEVALAMESRCTRHNVEGCLECIAKVFWGKPQKDVTGRLFYAADLGGRSWRIERLEKHELRWPGHSYVGCSYGYMLYEVLPDGVARLAAPAHDTPICINLRDAHDNVKRILQQAERRAREAAERERRQAEQRERRQAEQRAHVTLAGGLDGAREALVRLATQVDRLRIEYQTIANALTEARRAHIALRDAIALVEREGGSR